MTVMLRMSDMFSLCKYLNLNSTALFDYASLFYFFISIYYVKYFSLDESNKNSNYMMFYISLFTLNIIKLCLFCCFWKTYELQ